MAEEDVNLKWKTNKKFQALNATFQTVFIMQAMTLVKQVQLRLVLAVTAAVQPIPAATPLRQKTSFIKQVLLCERRAEIPHAVYF